MGAVPGGGVLIARLPAPFDPEPYRRIRSPFAAVRRTARPVLVLGSTQDPGVADAGRLEEAGVELRRRRGGGGAVLAAPDSTVWVDVWLPRHGALWMDGAPATARMVGAWWRDALIAAGADGARLAIHAGGLVRGPWSDLVCFAGRGPGEVIADGRKVVGLTQWRCREGALVQGCAYRTWDPSRLVDLLAVPGRDRQPLLGALAGAACGLSDLGAAGFGPGDLLGALPFPARWDVAEMPSSAVGQLPAQQQAR